MFLRPECISLLRREGAADALSPQPLAQIRRVAKDSAMFGGRIPIGHAGDVIADEARPAPLVRANSLPSFRPFRRHRARRLHEMRKEIADDEGGLIANADQARMPVEMLEQESLDVSFDRGGRRRKADEGRSQGAHLLDAAD